MATEHYRGMRTYKDPEFRHHINSFYYPLWNMEQSVHRLKQATKAGLIDIETMEYGEYQPILSPLHEWPNDKGSVWKKAVGFAKTSLDAQINTEPLSPDDPRVFATKGLRLNAAIQKCFNSHPPIPMLIDVDEKDIDDPHKDQHDIDFYWVDADKNTPPRLLLFTMICPYGSIIIPDLAKARR